MIEKDDDGNPVFVFRIQSKGLRDGVKPEVSFIKTYVNALMSLEVGQSFLFPKRINGNYRMYKLVVTYATGREFQGANEDKQYRIMRTK